MIASLFLLLSLLCGCAAPAAETESVEGFTFTDDLGRTVIVVMHDINFASRYSDNILAMNDGQVTHFDTCADTMKSSVLSEIFGTSVRIIDDVDGPLAVYF